MQKRRKKKKSPQIKKIILFISIIIGIIAIIFLYKSYQTNSNYPLAKIEVLEIRNQTIPEDVKKALELQKENQRINRKTYRVPILIYHYVEYVKDEGDTIRISLDITPYTFEKQIKTLLEANYTFLTNSELTDILNGKKQAPRHPILLTFDDGYEDLHSDVLPILKKYNIKATAYIIAGFTNRLNHLTDVQINEIISSGLVEIGAHTLHHSMLKGNNLENVNYEITQSKKILEERYHIKVVSFAYPYGAFDNQTIAAVKNAGFTSATSTIQGIEQSQENRYFLYRLRPGGRTGPTLLKWLEQKTFKEY